MLRRRKLEYMKEIEKILHLPLIERITHLKVKRLIRAVGVSGLIAIGGGAILGNAEVISHAVGVSEVITHTFGGTVHAVGIIPLIHFVEPLILAIAGTVE